MEDTDRREWLESRWRSEDERWERFMAGGEMTHALDMLGSPVATHRLIAARRMPELAERRPSGGPVSRGTEGYPYFTPIAASLSAALAVEEHPEVRGALQDSLSMLLAFAAEGEQQLLYAVIPHIADANRAALRTFKATLSRFLAKFGGDTRSLNPLVGFLALTPEKETTLQCLESLASDTDGRAVRDRLAALRVAQATIGEPAAAANNNLLDSLYTHAGRLAECRDVLAESLRHLQAPPPGAMKSLDDFDAWRRPRRLYLLGVYLAGARLANVHLPGAVLVSAYLQGTNLEGANLISAEMKEARLGGAALYGVLFRDTPPTLRRADLRGADWWNANESSWRGGGQGNLDWLGSAFPAPVEAEEPLELVTDEGDTSASDHPAYAPISVPPVPTAPMSAADKIAELKRRSNGGPVPVADGEAVPPAWATTESPTREDAAPEEKAPSRRASSRRDTKASDLMLSAGSVVVREKGLPRSGDRMSEQDINSVTDLMGSRYTPMGEVKVAVRESGLPRQGSVTDDDLAGITDLMGDR
jgi:hypothetical protein